MNAARGGNLTKLKAMIAAGSQWHVHILEGAAQENHFDVVKWAVETTTNTADSMTDMPMVCTGAAMSGNLGMLKYLRSKGFAWDGTLYRDAAEKGHVHIMQYAYENGCPIAYEPNHYWTAAYGGHINVLDWLVSIDYPWEPCMLSAAAQSGSLDVCKWVLATGKPCVNYMCDMAAMAGKLEVLMWARSIGMPWGSCLLDAARRAHWAVVEWALLSGCAKDLITGKGTELSLFTVLIEHRRWRLFLLAVICGVPIQPATFAQLPIATLSRFNNGQLSSHLLHAAACAGRMDILKLLHARGAIQPDWLTKKVFRAAGTQTLLT